MTILTQAQVTQAFLNAGVVPLGQVTPVMPGQDLSSVITFRRQTYAELEQDYVTGDFVLWFNDWLNDWSRRKWAEWWNCQDFAQMFCAGLTAATAEKLDALAAADSNAVLPQGPAAFESWGTNYPGYPGMGHAVVALIVEGGKAIWIEPQEDVAVKIYPMQPANCAAIENLL
jgi:hypothetical protein